MFSGIIERVASVSRADHGTGGLNCRIETGFAGLELGESIAVNGVCLTVVSFDAVGVADFYASPETLARTNLSTIVMGSKVNLERAVSLNTRLSGHLVQGHVDGMATLAEVIADEGSWRLFFDVPDSLARYCVEKGSIAFNGISLTINSLAALGNGQSRIGITIIPHTWEHTNLHAARPGDAINVEVDVMAKYVERLCLPYLKP
ncbi:MAG: riboflavin synthase [Proteobacteria bacterium]|nr:riboflavin synthase [Pseudomonadota bacterium]